MPRFSSQRTRQALLIQGNPLNPDGLSESIELFDAEGNPVDLNALPPGLISAGGATGQILSKVSDTDYDIEWVDPPAPPPPSGNMNWRGTWDPLFDYVMNDVVKYDNGDGWATYIFTEDSPAQPAGDPPMPDFDGTPVTMSWDPAVSSLPVTLDADSPLSGVVYNANSPYVAVVFKKVSGGLIEIKTAPEDGLYRNLIANFYKRNPAGTGWTYITQNDDSSGLGHPKISTSQSSNWFLFVLSTTDGADPTTQYGTSLITLGPSNTAVYEALAGAPDFPIDSVVQIG